MSFCSNFETPERKISIEHSYSQYFSPSEVYSLAVSAAPPAFKFCRLSSFQVSEQSPNPLSSLGMGRRLHFESEYVLHCSPVNRTAIWSGKIGRISGLLCLDSRVITQAIYRDQPKMEQIGGLAH